MSAAGARAAEETAGIFENVIFERPSCGPCGALTVIVGHE